VSVHHDDLMKALKKTEEAIQKGKFSGDGEPCGKPDEPMSRISIGGKSFHVLFVDRVNRDSFVMGETDFVEQVIRIDRGLKEDRRREVLLHEILHCIFEAAGDFESNGNEQLVCTIASGLNNVLAANQWLLSLFL